MIELNEDNFKEKVLKNKELFLVCFLSQSCPACHNVIPILEEVGKEFKTGIINIYENPKIADYYKIPAVPTLIIFKDGEAVEKAVGFRSKEILVNRLNSLLEKG